MRSGKFLALCLSAAGVLAAQGPPQVLPPANDPGRKVFENRCGKCHGGDAAGGEMGPNILTRLNNYAADQQLIDLIHNGLPAAGMPPTAVQGQELTDVVKFLHAITVRPAGRGGRGGFPARRGTVETTAGVRLEGVITGEGFTDMQLRTDDGKMHILRKVDGGKVREVTSQVDWPVYNGDPRGNRYTTIGQITKENVKQLGAKWIFAYPSGGRGQAAPSSLQMTPVVAGGIMYVTFVNDVIALDAGTGRQIWRFTRPRTQGVLNSANSNRGAAVAGDRLFLQTDGAQVVALNRFTGEQLWESKIADPAANYFGTSAPLVAGDLVIAGTGGGEHGANGLVIAFNQSDGKEAWRFNVIPKRGEPGSETWQGSELDHGGAPTWFTGSYDPELDTVYWPTGNPSTEYNGDKRPGDNLFANCMLAFDRKTGKLKWHYQYTPHDLWDWDSTETSILADVTWQGQPRKVMLHADRNGFYYVLDRTDGKLLLAKQFINELTWASGIGPDGRPVKLPNQEPSAAGTRVCPSQDGATNWYSPSFSPLTGMFYFQTNEKCSLYIKRDQGDWKAGESYLGGSQSTARGGPAPQRVMRAIDFATGARKWEIPQPGGNTWGGTLATSTGVVFFMEEQGALVAADATNGKVLWQFQANVSWHASPMTYEFDGKQYIAFAAGGNIIAMALPD